MEPRYFRKFRHPGMANGVGEIWGLESSFRRTNQEGRFRFAVPQELGKEDGNTLCSKS